MELLLEILLEAVVQVLLGAVLSIFDERLPPATGTRLYRLLGYFLLGGFFGWLSTLFFPRPTLSAEAARLAWLFAAPVLGGLAMCAVKALKRGWSGWLTPWAFSYGAALVGTVNAWRYFALA
ncbi:MAG: hypothetical protein AB1938_31190 [Myxococcota bacterium]